MTRPIVRENSLIDEVFDARREMFGRSYVGMRSHAYRMLNFARQWVGGTAERDEKIAICASFHDIALFPEGNLDYLDASVDQARAYLEDAGRSAWNRDMELMIRMHHKVRRYEGESAEWVEPIRRADWIDVSFGTIRFDLDRSFVREVQAAFPVSGFYPQTILGIFCRHVLRSPFNPLPNFRW